MALDMTGAFAHAPASTEKTALLADFNALNSELATTQAAGAFSADTLAQLQDQLIDLAEEVASNMTDHT